MRADHGKLIYMILALVALGSTLGGWSVSTPVPAMRVAREQAFLDYVIDGDTIALTDGRRVRLVQIDTPESGQECHATEATRSLERLLPTGSSITLEADPRLDQVDRYGRLLRYVFRGSTNVNLVLVRRGDATVWFYGGDRGRYAARFLSAARAARAARRGMWGACRVVWDPFSAATTSWMRIK